MPTIKCAICKKRIEDFDQYVVIGYGLPLPQYSLCAICAGPITAFLEAHGLISFTEAKGISWDTNPEDVITDVLDLDSKTTGQGPPPPKISK